MIVILFIFVSFSQCITSARFDGVGWRHTLAEQSGMTTEHRQLFWQFQTDPSHCGTHRVNCCGGS